MRVAVLGAGGWGTALAGLLAERGHRVTLWARRPEQARELAASRESALYLPGYRLSEGVDVTGGLEPALAEADLVVVAVPVQHLREVLGPARRWIPRAAVRLSASKGIERSSLLRVSEVLTELWDEGPFAVLSGPSFAAEVARGEPTAVTVASEDEAVVRMVQREISTETFRAYTTGDVVGVELAGALKNVMAIAAGIVRGLGMGSNALSALLTRGLAEVRRLGVALGGRPETFLGLAGVGDLVLTCTGSLSRNVRVGEAIARGATLAEAIGATRMVAEGVETALSAQALAGRAGVDMPITNEVVEVLYRGRDPRVASRNLMSRDLKAE